MPDTAIYDITYPADGTFAIPSQLQTLANSVETALGKIANAGALSSRPASGTFDGQRYFATDVIAEYRWYGAAWHRTSMPAGTMIKGMWATAPVGTILAYGQAVANAQTLYTELWAAMPATFKSGSTLNMPDSRGRGLVVTDTNGGSDANRMGTLTSTLGASGGSTTIAGGELPPHTHTIDHNHPSGTVVSNGAHLHTLTTHAFGGGSGAVFSQPIDDVAIIGYLTLSTQGLHFHSFDIPDYAGNTGNTGSGSSFHTPYLACSIALKL